MKQPNQISKYFYLQNQEISKQQQQQQKNFEMMNHT